MEVQIEPTVRQLEGIVGLLARENDCLRERIGSPASICFFHRSFTSDDLEIGRSLVTHITATPAGTVHVHLES